jgi:hypothetical protein
MLPRVGGALSFEVPPLDAPPSRAALWLVKLAPPTHRSYRIAVYLHPADLAPDPASRGFTDAFQIGEFAFWKAHHLRPAQTAGAVLAATAAFRAYAARRTPHLLTLVVEPLSDRGGHHHGGHHHGGSDDERLVFEGMALQVNGNGVPDIALGEVTRRG